jgi:hypothetical protein
VEHRATALVNHPKPAHLLLIMKHNMFFCIDLPDLMGHGRAPRLDSRPSAGRRRREVGPREPSAQRPRRGDWPRRVGFEELHSDELRSPGGVLAAQRDSGLHTVGGRRLVPRAAVPRRQGGVAVAAEALEQAIDGRARDPEPLGDLRGVPSLLPEPEHDLTDRDGDGAWHGRASRCQDQDKQRIAS